MLRGIAICLMVCHHLSYDLYYIFGQRAFDFAESAWFNGPFRSVIVVIFVAMAGVSSAFSTNNFRRSGKLLAAGLGLSLLTILASYSLQQDYYIFFQVLHLLAVCSFIYACLAKFCRSEGQVQAWLLVLVVLFFFFGPWFLSNYPLSSSYLLFLGPSPAPSMLDYLPLIPWAGCFFLGALLAGWLYPTKRSLFGAGFAKSPIICSLAWLGQRSFLIYLVHQPILLLVLFSYFKLV